MTLRILVAGGAGYIGSHMVKALRGAGQQVAVFDNLSRGHRDAVGDAPLFVGDLRDPDALDRCLHTGFDVVMHFAALAYVGESVQQPALYYDTNVVGTQRLLDAMRRHGVDRLVFSSTCATYGDPVRIPMDESHPQAPVNPYGRSKLVAEGMIGDYAAAYGLRAVLLRYFNAAGCDRDGALGERHDPETHLIPLVLAEALRLEAGGDPSATRLQVFGGDFDTRDGTCVRDYIHVDDLCAAHLRAAELLGTQAPGTVEAFNLGNGQGFSVLEVIDACRAVTGQPIGYRMAPRRPGDPATLVAHASRARAQLGWIPAVPRLEDIVATAWKWMRAHPRLAAGQAP